MRKIIKKLLKILGYFFLVLVLLLVAAFFAIRTEVVQTYLTQRAADYFSKKLNAKVSVEGVYIEFFKTIDLRGLYVEDQAGDTLLYLAHLKGDLSWFSLDENRFSFNKIHLEDGNFYLNKPEGSDELNLQFIIDEFKSEDTADTKPLLLDCDDFRISGMHFRYRDHNKPLKEEGIDYANLDIADFSLYAEDVALEGDSVRTGIRSMSLNDHSGFVLDDLEALVNLTPDKIRLNDLAVKTPNTDFQSDITLDHGEFANYSDFINKVRLNVDIASGKVSAGDIAYFAPALTGLTEEVGISGKVKGKIKHLKARDLQLTYGENTSLNANLDLDGLPDINETFMIIEVKDLHTEAEDLAQIPLPPFKENHTLEVPPELTRAGGMEFKGTLTGFLYDFVAFGELKSDLGRLKTDLNLDEDAETGKVHYDGKLSSYGFDLGRLLDQTETLGMVTMDMEVEGIGITMEDIVMDLKGDIAQFGFNQYQYKDLAINGKLEGKQFNGDLNVEDDNIQLDFRGEIDFERSLPEYQFTANIGRANLATLNLVDRDPSASLKGDITFDLRGDNLENLEGEVIARQLTFIEKEEVIDADSIKLIASGGSRETSIEILSDLMTMKLEGQVHTADLGDAFNAVFSEVLPAYFDKPRSTLKTKQNFTFDFAILEPESISKIFVGSVVTPEVVTGHGYFNSSSKVLELDVTTDRMLIVDRELSGNEIKVRLNQEVLNVVADIDRIAFGDSSGLSDFNINTKGLNNTIQMGVHWQNEDSLDYGGDINILGNILSSDSYSFSFLESHITVADSTWSVNSRNRVTINGNELRVRNLKFSSGEEFLELNGALSENPREVLSVKLAGVSLKALNPFTAANGFSFDGILNGNASIRDPYNDLIVNSNLDLNQVVLNDNPLGDGNIYTDWDSREKRVNLKGLFTNQKVETISFGGFYQPGDNKNNLNIKLEFEEFLLSTFQPVLKDALSDMQGIASGSVKITGKTSAPETRGRLRLENTAFKVDYLNTSYALEEQVVRILPDKIAVDKLTITDQEGKKALGSAEIHHQNYGNFDFLVDLDVNDFLCLNTNSSQNELYYGSAYLSGNIGFSGDFRDILIDVKAKTRKGTKLSIPLAGSDEVSESDYIVFMRKSTDGNRRKRKKVDLSHIRMNLDLELTNDAEAEIIFDQKVGDVITATGHGNLQLEINTLGQFNMYGEYIIDKGDYLFTLQNIINKYFIIEKGSRIIWTGDPYGGQADVNAIYKVRTSLYDLVAGVDSSVSTNPVNVECILNLQENLLDPIINFSIRIPENNNSSLANDLINNMSEQDLNRQVFSLLILKRFIPPDNTLHSEGFGSKSTGELLSNQLSNWLSQISQDFDIGFTYQPGDEITANEVKVALSTQLFNDRLLLEGNVGVVGENPTAEQDNSGLVGDFNVEYKITEDGLLRAKVFNRSNDNNQVNANNSPYTQGAGLAYRREFNTLGEFLRQIFPSKEEKARRREEERRRKEVERRLRESAREEKKATKTQPKEE